MDATNRARVDDALLAKFTLYLLAANVVVLALTHLLSEYGPVVNLIFAVVAVVMVITLDRKVLKRERL